MQPPTFNDLTHKTIEQRDSIIQPEVLPISGMLMMTGQPKVGKSFLLLRMMRDLAAGQPLYGCPQFPIPRPVKVHLYEQEIGEVGLQKRAVELFKGMELGALQRVSYCSKDKSLRLDTEAGCHLLYDWVKEVRPEVLCFDPIKRFHDWEEQSSQHMDIVLKRMEDIAQAAGSAVVFTHHDPKPSEVLSRRARGSNVFTATPDSIIYIDLQRNNQRERVWKLTFELRQQEEPPPMLVRMDKATLDIQFLRFLEDSLEVSKGPEKATKVPPSAPLLRH